MDTLLNVSLWDELLNFDELIHDFYFSEKVNDKQQFEDAELNDQD